MAKRKDKPETTDLGTLDMTSVPYEASYVDSAPQPDFGFYQASGHPIPSYATEHSAGMDISADLKPGQAVMCFSSSNQSVDKTVRDVMGVARLYIEPGERVLVPTGVHADISEDTFLAVHPRSGTSFKKGLILTNSVGVVDADYVEEIKVSLTNNSGARVYIEDGERVAQLLLMPVVKPLNGFKALTKKPNQKTSRVGGFGSTGVK